MTLKSKKFLKFKNISHGFFGKKGGVSSGIYTALNCGPGSNDKISNIKKNLKLFQKSFKFPLKIWYYLNKYIVTNATLFWKDPQKNLSAMAWLQQRKI